MEELLGKIVLDLSKYTDKWHPAYEKVTINIYVRF